MSVTNKEKEKKIIRSWQQGVIKKEISKRYGVTERTVKAILERNGIDTRRLVRYDTAMKKEADEMAQNGSSYIEISEKTGVSIWLAKQYVQRVEKEMMKIAEEESLIRAVPLEKERKVVVDGMKYIDLTDFIAGI